MKIKYIFLLIFFYIKAEYGLTQSIINMPKYHSQVKGYQSNNRLLLLQSAKKQEFKLLDSLLNQGLDINEPDVYGNTILGEILTDISDTSLVDSLIQRGACFNCGKYISQYVIKEGIESNYNEPLSNAILNKDTAIFFFLFRKYKNLGFENALSKPELIETAITTVNYKVLLELSHYFDFNGVNDRNIIGQTLITQTAESLAILYIIFKNEEKNVEIKKLFSSGIKIIEFLKSKGADLNKTNSKGETALSLLRNVPVLYEFLKSKKAK